MKALYRKEIHALGTHDFGLGKMSIEKNVYAVLKLDIPKALKYDEVRGTFKLIY